MGYNLYMWSHKPTYNWFLGPPCMHHGFPMGFQARGTKEREHQDPDGFIAELDGLIVRRASQKQHRKTK